jgi:FkbM family methyltransferase
VQIKVDRTRNVLTTTRTLAVKLIRNFAKAIKHRLSSFMVRRHYGMARPGAVRLPGSRSRIHIDPDDPRAYKILVVAPLFGRLARNQPFWTDACSRLAPTLALDLGLNFGECLFSGDYARHTELHGFEANPRLEPYVRKSRMEHAAREQMHLHFALVSSRPGPDAQFFIDRRWSGGSTAIAGLKREEASRYESIRMPVISVDSIMSLRKASRPGGTLVFKIDVEGYEFNVLKGMDRTLASPQWAVGLIEFDTVLLKKSGESLEKYWNFLSEKFDVYAFARSAKAVPVASWDELKGLFRKSEFHTDLLLVRGAGDERLESFLTDWTTGRRTNTLQRAA